MQCNMWSNKDDLGLEDRRTMQRIRNSSGICSMSASLVLIVVYFTDCLVLYPIWTLRILSVVYIFFHSTVYCLGLYGESDPTAWQWNRNTKASRKVWLCCKAVLLHLLSVALFYTIFVLFGAPFLSLYTETAHYSIFMTALVVFSGCLQLGCDENKWLRITLGNGPQTIWERQWLKSGISSLLGTWLGAFVIPLDWDRLWQVWPICCTYGSLAGYASYHFYNFLILHSSQRKRSSVRSKLIK